MPKILKVSQSKDETRFRGSIYVDVWVPSSGDIETDREEARRQLEEYAQQIPNASVGGVAYWVDQFKLDQEI
jgi:hypothetical protein